LPWQNRTARPVSAGVRARQRGTALRAWHSGGTERLAWREGACGGRGVGAWANSRTNARDEEQARGAWLPRMRACGRSQWQSRSGGEHWAPDFDFFLMSLWSTLGFACDLCKATSSAKSSRISAQDGARPCQCRWTGHRQAKRNAPCSSQSTARSRDPHSRHCPSNPHSTQSHPNASTTRAQGPLRSGSPSGSPMPFTPVRRVR
jgi:hypothetical protein